MKNKLPFIVVGLVVIVIVLWVGMSKKAEAPSDTTSPSSSPVVAQWVHYKNAKYGFELSHPSDWQIHEDAMIPVINVYKKSETAKPPFTIHSTSTAIAIFPEGLGTEGPIGQTQIVEKFPFAGKDRRVVMHILGDKTTWATFIPVDNGPKANKWSEYAFVWAGLDVRNLSIKCLVNGKESPVEKCSEMGIEMGTVETIRYGSIHQPDATILGDILKTFKFSQ